MQVSDHRPVLAVFDAQYRRVEAAARARVVRELVRGAASWDGVVLLRPGPSLDSVAAALQPWGEVVGVASCGQGLLVTLDSVSRLGALLGAEVRTEAGSWTASLLAPCDAAQLLEAECSLLGRGDEEVASDRRPAPARPAAPPSRPAPRPTRRAPGVPGKQQQAGAGLAVQLGDLGLEDEERPAAAPPPALAPLDWPEEGPRVQLAPLTWPADSYDPPAPTLPPPAPPPALDMPPAFAPPSLDTEAESSAPPPFSPPKLDTEAESSAPPPFSQTNLDTEADSAPPPFSPPSLPPPRLPARPVGRVPPPVPKR